MIFVTFADFYKQALELESSLDVLIKDISTEWRDKKYSQSLPDDIRESIDRTYGPLITDLSECKMRLYSFINKVKTRAMTEEEMR